MTGSGAAIDGGLFLRVTDLARHSPHFLNQAVEVWTTWGLALFAVLLCVAWWTARGRDSARMARVLCAPLIVVAVFAVDDVLKSVVAEHRPCQAFPGSFTVESCPAAGDWSFPSNHAVVAAAAATVLWSVNRTLGILAAAAALAMAASRVWVGVHYPHDVLAGLAIGVAVAAPLAVAAGRAAPWVEQLRRSRWHLGVAKR